MHASNKPHDTILDHYSAECPVCRGVLLPEKVKELEGTVRILQDHIDGLHSEAATIERLEGLLTVAHAAADQWRDLYMARNAEI